MELPRSGCLLLTIVVMAARRLSAAEVLRHSSLDCSSTRNKVSGAASCSPIQCNFNVEPDCEINSPPPPIDHKALLAELTCKQCQQATHGMCTRPAYHLRVAHGHIYAAYCNDEFMVIHSDSLPRRHTLNKIPQPPRMPDRTDLECRVRMRREQIQVFKVPLYPSYLADPASNNIPAPLPMAMTQNMPRAGAIGVAVDGLAMATNYNENGLYQWTSCSLDQCNGRVEDRFDYKYHGDPFGPGCLYGIDDYRGEHPPLIGWALDGYAIYGRYIEEGRQAVGVHEWLDECGGHTHPLTQFDESGQGADVDTYHYHTSVEIDVDGTLEGTAGGPFKYNAYKLGPGRCFRGAINAIPNFWDASGERANYDRRDDGNSTTPILSAANANDFEQLRPCCGMVHYYAKPGFPINGAGENAPYPPYPPPIPLPPYPPAPPSPPPDLTDDLIGIGMASGAGVSLLICCACCCYLYRRYDGTPEWRGGMDKTNREKRRDQTQSPAPGGPTAQKGAPHGSLIPFPSGHAMPPDHPYLAGQGGWSQGPPLPHQRIPPHEYEMEHQKLWTRDELVRRNHEWQHWQQWQLSQHGAHQPQYPPPNSQPTPPYHHEQLAGDPRHPPGRWRKGPPLPSPGSQHREWHHQAYHNGELGQDAYSWNRRQQPGHYRV